MLKIFAKLWESDKLKNKIFVVVYGLALCIAFCLVGWYGYSFYFGSHNITCNNCHSENMKLTTAYKSSYYYTCEDCGCSQVEIFLDNN